MTSRAGTAGDTFIHVPDRASEQPPPSKSRELLHQLRDETLDPKQLGRLGEQYGALWLEKHGHTILERNWHSRYGELDIISLSADRLIVFSEVKTRRCEHFGSPQEAVTARKQSNVRRAGVQWLLDPAHRISHDGVRFDVISIVSKDGLVSVHHIPGAF